MSLIFVHYLCKCNVTTLSGTYIYIYIHTRVCGGGADRVVGIATGYGLDSPGIESGWGRDFLHLSQTDPGTHPDSCAMGTGSFPGVKSGRGVTLTPHRLLVPWSRKSRAIPLLVLRAVRPVQSLSACTRVHFTYFRRCNPARPVSWDICQEGK